MTSQTGRVAPAAVTAVTAANAYTPRERKLILTFAIVGALIESMELNLLSFPLRDLAGSFAVTNQAVVGVITLQSIASIAGGLLFGWLADRHGRRLTYVAFTALYFVNKSLVAHADISCMHLDGVDLTRPKLWRVATDVQCRAVGASWCPSCC